ncbi:MAG: helix-hairpin-helix domain-containing protein [Arenicellales bacterium]|jgi:competence protein ComEA|nr:helix-hairpin-helix domain-containing protein [Arenicellales bacterium]MDP7156493.1 helix-hairpin-helix domain-containing protein [Arenicellales bacterium]MDP7284301.1 helix-hairpin-helix domain-containing protein [Arenicellales bacterium]MDP7481991.1 helix-hairpin-helix domain-containing protein [Arenicellales bacterium]|tara:strand:- start:1396 stop:1710 length:315 start_codon:yes stop_codon:yes gene_type:complete
MNQKILSLLCGLALAFSTVGAIGGERVDVNSADAETLAICIDGVGEVLAARIVAYREQNGLFAEIEELMNIKGIGVKIIELNREYLIITLPEGYQLEAKTEAES